MKFKSKGLLFASLVLAAQGCGRTETDISETKIVGGVLVETADPITKSTVALIDPTGFPFCTGSLIDAKHVLTASHCLAEYDKDHLYVAFGVSAKNLSVTAANVREASYYQAHENFNTAAMDAETATQPPNDIGFITLSRPAPAGFAPVGVLHSNDQLVVGEKLTLAGFGLTFPFFGRSGVLRKVESKLHSVSTAAKEIEFGDSPGKSACNGDSGGPAFVTRNNTLMLVGITSRGPLFCNANGIYTDVRPFDTWIASKVAAHP